MMSKVLIIRVDASAEIGAGHAMRMIALAQAWQQRGGQAHVVASTMPAGLAARLNSEQINCTFLARHENDFVIPGSKHDAQQTTTLAEQLGANWIVADGYHYGANFQSSVRAAGLQCAVVTDFDYCQDWRCNLILNQNPHATKESYHSSDGSPKRLLGTRFALLRQEFVDADESSPERRPGEPSRLLMTFGGSDPPNATGHLLSLLESWDQSELQVRVLVGVANPHRAAIEALANCSQHDIELLTDVRDMPAQYLWADGIISAGGGTCWEWLYFGLRGAILVIADNQSQIYRELVDANAALGLGSVADLQSDPSSAQSTLWQLLADLRPLDESQRKRYRNLVDGYGAQRVAAELDGGVWLRVAEQDDCKLYFQWANDPTVREQSLTSDEITWDGHRHWFANQLDSPDTQLLVGMRDDSPIGQIRFTKTTEQTSNQAAWNVAFSVAAEARGTGAGKELLRLGAGWMTNLGLTPLTATVKMANVVSARCFQRLGWQEIAAEDPALLCFVKR